MTSTSRSNGSRDSRRRSLPWQAIIDGGHAAAVGAMLLRFTVTGKLYLLLHPDYMWLAHLAMVLLFGHGRLGRVWQVWQVMLVVASGRVAPRSQEHIALLPRRLSVGC
jgi:hypothetical protein